MSDPFDETDNDFMANFTNEELRFGIDKFAKVRLGMSGDDFIAKVRNGDEVHHLHERALEIADLVRLLDQREGSTNEEQK